MKNFIDTTFTTVTQSGDKQRVPDLGGYETDNDVHYSVMDRGDGTCLTRVTAPSSKMSSIKGASATTVLTDSEARADISDNRPSGTGLENLDQPDVEVDAILDAHTVDDLLTSAEKKRVRVVLGWTRELNRNQRLDVRREYDVNSPQALVDQLDEAGLDDLIAAYDISPLPSHIDPSTAARAAVQVPTKGQQVLQDQELTAMMKAAKAEGRKDAGKMSPNTRDDMSGKMNDNAEAILGGSQADHDKMLDYVKGNAGPPWGSSDNPHAVGTPSGGA